MSNSGLARLISTVVVLIGLAIWLKSERSQTPHGCQNLPNRYFGQPQITDDSGSRYPGRFG